MYLSMQLLAFTLVVRLSLRNNYPFSALLTNPPLLPLSLSLLHTLTDSDRSLGIVIVSGKAQSVYGTVLEGVFVQKVLPGSPADRDGR